MALIGMTMDREDQHQDDEAGAEHKGKDDWRVHVDDVEEVGGLSGYAPNIDLGGHTVESGGNVGCLGARSDCRWPRGYWACPGRKRQQRQIAGVVDLEYGRHRKVGSS